MGRYVITFNSAFPPEQTVIIVNNFYVQNDFSSYSYKGEHYQKKGDGFLTAPQIMRVLVNGNSVTIEAFTRYAILPGVYSGEIDPNRGGFVGSIPNSMLMSKVNALVQQLSFNPQAGQQYRNNSANQQNTRVQYNSQPAENQQIPYVHNQNVQGDSQQQNNFTHSQKQCPNCGTLNGANDNFCAGCGTLLNK